MLTIVSETPLTSKSFTLYKGLAYDGCWFYLTVHDQCQIIKCDDEFHKKQCFETCRSYTYICYDTSDKCFWASADAIPCMIYKLNECMEEIDAINLRIRNLSYKTITGLSYDCCNDYLLVSLASCIVRIDKKCNKNSCILSSSNRERVFGVVTICPYYICYYASDKNEKLYVYNDSGTLIHEFCFTCDYNIESAVFFPRSKDATSLHVYALITKQDCYPYILDCTLDCDIFSDICECNFDICNCSCPEEEDCRFKKCCCDVLESIALVECSIAHILNAEGEKIQKVVASTDDIDKILEANESVHKVMEKAIRLELLLCSKLETLRDCWDFCNDSDLCDCMCEEIEACHNEFTQKYNPINVCEVEVTDITKLIEIDNDEAMDIIDSVDISQSEVNDIIHSVDISQSEVNDIIHSVDITKTEIIDIANSADNSRVEVTDITDAADITKTKIIDIADTAKQDKIVDITVLTDSNKAEVSDMTNATEGRE